MSIQLRKSEEKNSQNLKQKIYEITKANNISDVTIEIVANRMV